MRGGETNKHNQTVVLRLGEGELVGVVVHKLSKLVEEVAALAAGHLGPWTLLEGSAGSSNSKV